MTQRDLSRVHAGLGRMLAQEKQGTPRWAAAMVLYETLGALLGEPAKTPAMHEYGTPPPWTPCPHRDRDGRDGSCLACGTSADHCDESKEKRAGFPRVPIPGPVASVICGACGHTFMVKKGDKLACPACAKADAPKLPTFDELQEGDWVQLARWNDSSSPLDGYVRKVEGGWIYTNRNSVECSGWHIVAFKPLRQVVEEMAAQVTGSSMQIDNTGFGCHMVLACSFGAAHALKVVHPDERTALLAAKAALEVMIAYRARPLRRRSTKLWTKHESGRRCSEPCQASSQSEDEAQAAPATPPDRQARARRRHAPAAGAVRHRDRRDQATHERREPNTMNELRPPIERAQSHARRALIGKRILSVEVGDGGDWGLRLETDQGTILLYADSDCCSLSWIAHVNGVEALIDHVVANVDYTGGDTRDATSAEREAYGNGNDVVSIYKVTFTTDAGRCDVDFRNASNGYYLGWFEVLQSPENIQGANEGVDWKPITGDWDQ